jgi:hypothetical protein
MVKASEKLNKKIEEDLIKLLREYERNLINRVTPITGLREEVISDKISESLELLGNLIFEKIYGDSQFKLSTELEIIDKYNDESRIGADLLVVKKKYWGNLIKQKALLIQAKVMNEIFQFDGQSLIISTSNEKFRELKDQINNMKKFTKNNYVFLYTENGIFVFKGQDILDQMNNSQVIVPIFQPFPNFYAKMIQCENSDDNFTKWNDPLFKKVIDLTQPRLLIVISNVLKNKNESMNFFEDEKRIDEENKPNYKDK